MRHTISLVVSLIATVVLVGAVWAAPKKAAQGNGADPLTLVDLGVFAHAVGNPSGFGIETQVYELDQRQVAALVDPTWLPYICSSGVPLNDQCVRVIEVQIKSVRPYYPVYLHLMRAGVEVNLIEWDDNKVGGVAVGNVSAEEGTWISVTYALGMITPQKTHTLRIWSPSAGTGNGAHVISGMKIMAVPVSKNQ